MAKIQSNGNGFFKAPNELMDHPAFRRLSATAQATWFQFGRAYNGRNNGLIQMSARILADRLNTSKNSAARAVNELLTIGFLEMTAASSFSGKRRAAEYRLTHLKCDRTDTPASNAFLTIDCAGAKVIPIRLYRKRRRRR